MKVAVLADIHANLEALEAVLIAAEKDGAQRFFVLGDVVGYGIDPVACINRLKEIDAVCVMGNHDQAMVEPSYLKELNPLARSAILSTRQSLGDPELTYLKSFPFRHIEHGASLTHANPIIPEDWQHIYLYEHVRWCLEEMDWEVAFVGHTHHRAVCCQFKRGHVANLTSSMVALGRHRYLVNPGSVGQPRDGDWRASYALWDLERSFIELNRIEYPVRRTQEKLAQAEWPDFLVKRLATGE
jgi:predicted phosphodiesterase